MKIWKYVLPGPGAHRIEMPGTARILSCEVQRGKPVFWALVDETLPTQPRGIVVAATGESLPEAVALATFIGTFQLHGPGGDLVFHVFDAGYCP